MLETEKRQEFATKEACLSAESKIRHEIVSEDLYAECLPIKK